MFYVYIIESSNRSWYIGYTQHLNQRIEQHQHGAVRTTRGWPKPLKLIYAEFYRHKRDAFGREESLKSGAGLRFLKKQLSHYLRDRS